MTNVLLYGSKGGVGTTTLALGIAKITRAAMVVQITDQPDAASLAGDVEFEIVAVNDLEDAHAAVTDAAGDVVLDFGTRWRLVENVRDVAVGGSGFWPRLLVVSNDYGALRLATQAPRPDAVACTLDTERTLQRADVENVLHGLPVGFVHRDRAVERMMDSGTLGSRTPRPWQRHVEHAVAQLPAIAR
jgi:hypothetical protein